MKRGVNLSGQRFGRWLVLRPDGVDSSGNIAYRCRCDCGIERIVSSKLLKKGRSRSCGCLRSDLLIGRPTDRHPTRLPPGVAEKNAFLRELQAERNVMKSRSLECDLSDEVALIIVSRNCYYCNETPEVNCSKRKRKKKANGKFNRNGIDRFDNNKGLTMENCVACCWDCNKAKGRTHGDDFLRYLFKISKNFKI